MQGRKKWVGHWPLIFRRTESYSCHIRFSIYFLTTQIQTASYANDMDSMKILKYEGKGRNIYIIKLKNNKEVQEKFKAAIIATRKCKNEYRVIEFYDKLSSLCCNNPFDITCNLY